MPTYLTPGVYVEEVPSANKPIEGVSTSIAAFVGLAPGGPVNTPMRISNWTQFAKIYGDPNEPDNGPFMEGAYLAHSVYGFFQNGGNLCWIVRVGDDGGSNGRGPSARAALPAASDAAVEAFSVVALEAGRDDITVEIVRGAAAGEGADKTYTVKVTRRLRQRGVHRPDAQEGPHQPGDQGQRGLEADQDRGDRRVAARGAARPGRPARSALSAPSIDPTKVKRTHFEGDVAKPARHGRPGRGRRDHDGRDAGHHEAGRRRRRRRRRSATSRAR